MKDIELNNYGRMINLQTEDHVVDVYEDCHSGGLRLEIDNDTYIYHDEECGLVKEIITHIERLEYEKAVWVHKYFLLKKELICLKKQSEEEFEEVI